MSAVYYPEDLSLLGNVLDQVVQSLPPNLRTPYNRLAIARNILDCALNGERDPDVLGRAARRDGPYPNPASRRYDPTQPQQVNAKVMRSLQTGAQPLQ